MTKVGRLYEQEKQEEIDKALSAAGMLFKGMSVESGSVCINQHVKIADYYIIVGYFIRISC